MSDAEKKVAVVTGASSGIGMATALALADEGYGLVLAARRKKELEEVARQCEEKGVEALAVAVDMSSETSSQKLLEAALTKFGYITTWINNAAVYMTGKFEDVPLEDARRLMDVNFFGYIYGSRAALAQFRSQDFGTLINISSVNAAAPQPYVSIYSASKAAVRAFDEAIRMELKLEGLDRKIHVCTVMPASVDTNLFQNSANYSGNKIQSLEPVYDPTYVAKHIVKLAEYPKREVIVGPAGKVMALQNAHAPRMYEKQIARFTQKDLISEDTAAATAGNLYESIDENRGMRGGWREHRLRADQLNTGLSVGLAAIAGLTYLALKRARHSS